MKKDEKRARILRAAETLLARHRMHEVKLDDVAARAGVGKGTIYLYFKDKDDLIFQVALAGTEELRRELLEIAAVPEMRFEERLLLACRRVTQFFGERKALIRMMQWEDYLKNSDGRKKLKETWARHRAQLVDSLAAVVDIGSKNGSMREDVPSRILAEYLLGFMRTRARALAEAPEEFRDISFVVRLFLEGAGARSNVARGKEGRLSAALGGAGKIGKA